MSKFSCVLGTVFAWLTNVAFANTWIDPDSKIEWTYTIRDGTASIGSGSGAVSVTSSGEITVPSTIGEYPVTEIGDWAFYKCSKIESVTIPEGITSIGKFAFSGCTALSKIRWPSTIRSIGINAFNECIGVRSLYLADLKAYCSANYAYEYDNYLNSAPLSCVNESACVTLFLNDNKVTLLEIPDGVTKIPRFAFKGTSIYSITLPPSLKSCSDGAFASCGNLSQVGISDLTAWFNLCGNGPLKLGGRLIVNGEIVSHVDVPDGVTSIDAFRLNASNLKSAKIPSSVTWIDWAAFSRSSLTNIYFCGNAPGVGDDDSGEMQEFEYVDRPSATVSVGYSSTGWNVTIPGTWKGLTIVRRPPETYCIYLATDPDDPAFCQCYSIGEGSWVGDIPEPAREGYAFLGWYTSAEGGLQYDSNTVVTKGMTLYAHWKLKSRMITFDANGGSCGADSLIVTNGASSTVQFPVPMRKGYKFQGWYTALDGGEMVSVAAEVETDVTLFAHWTAYESGDEITEVVDGIKYSGFVEWDCESVCLTNVVASGGSEISLPSQLGGLNLQTLGECLFASNTTLSLVVIPSNVVSFQSGVFSGCSNCVVQLNCACPGGYEESDIADVKEVVFPEAEDEYATYDIQNVYGTLNAYTDSALYITESGVLQVTGEYYNDYTFTESYSYLQGWASRIPKEFQLAVLLRNDTDPYYEGDSSEWMPIRSSDIATSYFGRWTVHVKLEPTMVNCIEGRFAEVVLCSKIYHGVVDSTYHGEYDWQVYHYIPNVVVATGAVCGESVKEVRQGDVIAFNGPDGEYFYCGTGAGYGSPFVIEGYEPTDLCDMYNGFIGFMGTCQNGVYYWRVPDVCSDTIYGPSGQTTVSGIDTASPYRRYWFTLARYDRIWEMKTTANTYMILPVIETKLVSFNTAPHAIGCSQIVGIAMNMGMACRDPWHNAWETISFNNYSYGNYGAPCIDSHEAGWDVEDGWRFVGWVNESGLFTNDVGIVQDVDIEKNMAYSAVYEPIEYQITYVVDGDVPNQNPQTFTVTNDFDFIKLEGRDGFTFAGWMPKRIEIGTFGDIVVTGRWCRVTNDVQFVLGCQGVRVSGGATNQRIGWEEVAEAPSIECKPGWKFSGWDKDVSQPITLPTTFVAQYECIPYSISYQDTYGLVNGNVGVYTVTNEISFSALENRQGWTFAGWSPSAIAMGTTGDLVVSAKWERVYHAVEIGTVHGSTTGGGDYEYGSEVTLHAPELTWCGELTNYVCLGSSSFLPLTNEVVIVATNDVSFSWDVWQTNYLFRTAANPAGTFYAHGAVVEQTAVAEAGYRFYKWIGDVDGNACENPKTFVMTQARYVEPVFVEEKVATPSISIPNGTVLSNATQTVTMQCSTPGATIYYTLDGTMPSAANGTKYTKGGFVLDQTALIRAVAVKDGSDGSEVASSAVVHLAAGESLPKITITPDTSVQEKTMIYVTFGSVSISGLTVERRYTTDGSQPTAASTLYNGKFILAINGTRFVKAAMFVNGVRVGDVTSVRYMPSIADVIVKHGEGCGAVTIENEAVRPWTVDESTISPDGNLSMRSGRITDSDGSKMYAYFNGDGIIEFNWKSSCESGSYPEYDLYVDHLVCRLDGNQVAWLDGETDWTNVAISVSTTGEHMLELVYYKDDADDDPYPGEDCGWISDVKFSYAAYVNFEAGADAKGTPPDAIVSSAGYSVRLPGCGDLRCAKHAFVGWQYGADVYAEGDSLIVDAQEMTLTPVWVEKHLTVPVVDVAAEYDEESTVVTITNAEGVAIYYTTDGSVPTIESKKYSVPFAVVGTTTIRAIALDDDWFDSPIASKTTTRSWATLEDCLTADGFTLATGGDRNWIGNAEDDGVRSVALNPGEISWLSATFTGAGVVEWWSRSSTTGWTRCTKVFPTVEKHILRWEGSDIWIKDLKFTPGAVAMFVSNESIAGEMPDEIYSAPGYEISMPSFSGFSREKYTFNGWTDGVKIYHPNDTYTMTGDVTFVVNWSPNRIQTPKIAVASWYDTEMTTVKITVTGKHGKIYYTLDGSTPTCESVEYVGEFEVAGTCTIKAISVCDNYFDSEVAKASTVRAPWTINECLNNTNLVFSMGGDTNWTRCIDASADGYCMQSGGMEDGQETWIGASVTGSGVLNFACKVSSEGYYRGKPLDYIDFRVDDAPVFILAGITDWTNVTVKVSGDGEHTIRWRYFKDDYQDPVVCDDCAWLDRVTWIPASSDAIPELGDEATPQEVASALEGSVDARLKECITNIVNYNAYRDWAANVKAADGSGRAGAQSVKEAEYAWFAFAIGSDKLISELPTSDDIHVEMFTPSLEPGKFDFAVSVEGLIVGKEAVIDNLKQVFGLEGGASLEEMEANNVDVTFGTPVDGKVKFTAGPNAKNANAKTFFMKVKLKP